MKRLPAKLLIQILFIPLFFIYSSILVGNSSFVYADFASAYQDYVYNTQLYKNSASDFQIAKSSYLTYRTLTSQNDAINKFRTVLKARAKVIAVYYDLLQEKLNSTAGISSEQKSTFDGIRQSEQNWLDGHQKKIDASSSLDDLNSAAAEFESRYPQIDTETKQTIGEILIAKESTLAASLNALISATGVKLSDLQKNGSDTTNSERGLIQARNKLDLFGQKSSEAQLLFTGSSKSGSGLINIFDGQSKLIEANQYLREGTNFVIEIIKSFLG